LAFSNTLFRVQLLTPGGRAVLGIGNHILSVSVLRPYEGWQQFKPRISKALTVYMNITQQFSVKRIGLRYINRLVTPVPEASSAYRFLTHVATTLDAVEANGAGRIEGKLTALNTRHEFETPERIKMFMSHATLTPQRVGTAEYLLDIDAVYDHQILEGAETILQAVEKLHAIEGGLFEHLITDEARKLFNGT
jgi:uncharacterized protein (TIGR04255 family)